jgi:hypothetical protein
MSSVASAADEAVFARMFFYQIVGRKRAGMITLIRTLAHRISLIQILIFVVGLNLYWTLTLTAFSAHFTQIANAPLLDLENTRGVLVPDTALTLVNTYSPEARGEYWSFFILDNIIPPIVFGSFAVLWAKLLSGIPYKWSRQLLNSPLLLVPFGVGLFDCLENLCFVLVMSADAGLPTMQVGLMFVQLKALCLFLTFGLTPIFTIAATVISLRQRFLSMQYS